MAKSRRQPTMRGRIEKLQCLIVVLSAFRDVSGAQQGRCQRAMPDHERDYGPLLLGECQELRRKFTRHIAVECNNARNPEAVEDREQQ